MGSITAKTFKLAAPFWLKSPDRFAAWGLGVALLALVAFGTGMGYWMNLLQKAFYDALQKGDAAGFNRSIGLFFLVIALMISALCAKAYLEQGLAMRWRLNLTQWMMGRWLTGHMFYRMERDATCDNPDQRLSEDTTEYTRLLIQLVLGFIANLGTLGTMGWILWQSAGPMTFKLGGGSFTIPGYLFWVAIGWGVLQTLATHLSGRRLAGATVQQQSVEADFRFALAKVRDASEQIALYRGNAIEQRRLLGLFEAIRANWAVLMKHNVFLNLTSGGFSAVSVAVPIVAVAPKVLAGELSIGTLMQDVGAFAATTAAIAWFALSYRDLFQLSARVQRLSAMNEAMRLPAPQGITLDRESPQPLVQGRDIRLAVPSGRVLTAVDALDFAPGDRWLVRGPSGCGKSTLLRAIAGLWPFGSGRISLPKGGRIMFMPQKSYLPDGPLREVLAYPAEVNALDGPAFAQALTDCRLPHLVPRLDESARWGHTLSPGEQQRLAFAQALLNRPDVLFMDEATSALDNDTEAHLIQLVIHLLPHCTVVSVAHRTTLDAFHDQRLILSSGGAPA